MRLTILDHGHRFTQKLRFWLMQRVSGNVPDPVRVLTYRRDWFGAHFADCLEEGMRGSTQWTKAEAELFAAFVSKLNRCEY